jgi:hypothetical protein
VQLSDRKRWPRTTSETLQLARALMSSSVDTRKEYLRRNRGLLGRRASESLEAALESVVRSADFREFELLVLANVVLKCAQRPPEEVLQYLYFEEKVDGGRLGLSAHDSMGSKNALEFGLRSWLDLADSDELPTLPLGHQLGALNEATVALLDLASQTDHRKRVLPDAVRVSRRLCEVCPATEFALRYYLARHVTALNVLQADVADSALAREAVRAAARAAALCPAPERQTIATILDLRALVANAERSREPDDDPEIVRLAVATRSELEASLSSGESAETSPSDQPDATASLTTAARQAPTLLDAGRIDDGVRSLIGVMDATADDMNASSECPRSHHSRLVVVQRGPLGPLHQSASDLGHGHVSVERVLPAEVAKVVARTGEIVDQLGSEVEGRLDLLIAYADALLRVGAEAEARIVLETLVSGSETSRAVDCDRVRRRLALLSSINAPDSVVLYPDNRPSLASGVDPNLIVSTPWIGSEIRHLAQQAKTRGRTSVRGRVRRFVGQESPEPDVERVVLLAFEPLVQSHRLAHAIVDGFRHRAMPFALFLWNFDAELRLGNVGPSAHASVYTGAMGYSRVPDTAYMYRMDLDGDRVTDATVLSAAAKTAPIVSVVYAFGAHVDVNLPGGHLLLPDIHWIETVAQLVSCAEVIVVHVAFMTTGLRMEMDLIRGRGRERDTLVVLADEAEQRANVAGLDLFRDMYRQRKAPAEVVTRTSDVFAGMRIVDESELAEEGALPPAFAEVADRMQEIRSRGFDERLQRLVERGVIQTPE